MENLGIENVESIFDIFPALVNHNEPLTIDNVKSRLLTNKEITEDELDDSYYSVKARGDLVTIINHPIWYHPKVHVIQSLVGYIDSDCTIMYALNEFHDLLQSTDPIKQLKFLVDTARAAEAAIIAMNQLPDDRRGQEVQYEQQQYENDEQSFWIFEVRSSGELY
jgi:hypothetical protein